tara:strand:+ start:683 stop:1150 length:468 start_codon:yes stop_codon:yes gene_type:complete
MKIKILIYLLSFVFLVLLFQIFNTNKILNYQNSRLKVQNDQIRNLKEDLQQMRLQASQSKFFTISEVPQSNFEKNLSVYREKLQKALQQINKDNPNYLFEKEKLDGIALLEKIHILNSRWIIAHFNNQSQSGDILIEYDRTSKGFQFSPLTIVYD